MRFGLELAPQRRVYGAFFIYSFCMGSLFPRLPDLQRTLSVAEGALGLALIGTACGTLTSLTFAGPLLERIGYRRAILVLIPLLSLFYAVAVLATNPLALFVLLLPVGLAIGMIEIIINLEADRTEHKIGHRIMNRSHGFWSLGFFTSGLVGAGLAQAGVDYRLHLALIVPVAIVATLLVLGRFDPAPHRVVATDGPRFARPTFAIGILVVVTLSAMILEGAGADWSAIYMRKEFTVSPFTSGIAVAIGALTQALTRMVADNFVERYSPVDVARVLLGILGVGAVIVFFSPDPWLSLVGFGLMGIGTSAIFPLAMSAAAQRTDRHSAVNVAALAQTSFSVFLFGPPLLGFIAEHFGIRWSFGIGLPLVVLSLLTAQALGRKPIPREVD